MKHPDIFGVIFNLERGATEDSTGDGEISRAVIHLYLALADMYSGCVRWEVPFRPDLNALSAR